MCQFYDSPSPLVASIQLSRPIGDMRLYNIPTSRGIDVIICAFWVLMRLHHWIMPFRLIMPHFKVSFILPFFVVRSQTDLKHLHTTRKAYLALSMLEKKPPQGSSDHSMYLNVYYFIVAINTSVRLGCFVVNP